MKERRKRSAIVLATKGCIDFRKAGTPTSLAREDLDEDIEESLAFLDTEVIDLYWLP